VLCGLCRGIPGRAPPPGGLCATALAPGHARADNRLREPDAARTVFLRFGSHCFDGYVDTCRLSSPCVQVNVYHATLTITGSLYCTYTPAFSRPKGRPEKVPGYMHRPRDKDLGRKIGDAMAKARHDVGWTQERLAEALDISVVHAGLLERGQRLPSISTLISMAEVLDLSLDGLFLKKRQGGSKPVDEVSRLVNALDAGIRPMVIAFLKAGAASARPTTATRKRA
jgi:transcriptional regulator with XRE-family HTH domain